MQPETKAAVGTAAGGGSGLGIGVLVVWIAGYNGVEISAEVGTVIGGLMIGIGSAIGTYGFLGIWKHLLYGQQP